MEQIVVTTNFAESCYYDQQNQIRFDPPVYEQRYCTILRLLELRFWKNSFKKIVEFGCAEMKFFRLLRSLSAVEKLLEVDIDGRLLRQCQHLVRPLLADYIAPRASPFTVEVWRGDISVAHNCLQGTDVVIGIEIIEHLHQPVLDKVPENVFGFIKPKVALFSTPNAEYNVLFDSLLPNGFRHDDHKFEWTRAQFQEWASDICSRYPDYCVKYFGIGPPPLNSEAVGYVSQLAVFVRKDFLDSLSESIALAQEPSDIPVPVADTASRPIAVLNEETDEIHLLFDPSASGSQEQEPDNSRFVHDDVEAAHAWRQNEVENYDLADDYDDGDDDEYDEDEEVFQINVPEEELRRQRVRNDSGNYEEEEIPEDSVYELIFSSAYPVTPPDERSREKRVQDAAEYQFRILRFISDDYLDAENDRFLIPLETIRNGMVTEEIEVDELREILSAAGYKIVDGFVMLDVEQSSDEEDVDYDFDGSTSYEPWPEGIAEGSNNQVVAGAAVCLADDDEKWD
ncbi:uncharacterized protein LOC131210697 [Anopheles bellator]|uniref:uncharacterized protein LOC131210697 n=1 Tax=Anopheles bellator TaxID=139047 RepID=UPI0026477FD2|nr:uncharacterized protein LOC131210697 [Anopheles bellator]